MTDKSKTGPIRLEPRPNYVPRPRTPAHAAPSPDEGDNHHTRELARRFPIGIRVITPECCPMCKSETISEVLERGFWWWRCDACGYLWDPERATT